MNKKLMFVAGALAAVLALPAAPALAATPASVTLSTAPALYQGALLTLTISAGDLQIQGRIAPGFPTGLLVLQGLDAAIEPLTMRPGPDGQLNARYALPAGSYHLMIAPSVWQSLTITGPDLTASSTLPQVSLAGHPFENANAGVTLTPTVSGASSLLWSGPDGKGGLFSASGGTFAPLTLPTSSLADGLYIYTVVAPDGQTGNAALAMRPVLIDRVDTFPDMPTTHWARRWVEVAYHMGIVSGRPDGSFAPEANVTRGEFAKLLAATLGLDKGQAAFADLEGHWAAPWIQALGDAGIVQGELIDGKRYFHPDTTITRQEAAAMVARAFARQAGPNTPNFPDWDEVDLWAQGPVAALVDAGWLSGFPDGTFGPRRLLSRSQAAKLLGSTFGM